MFQCLVFIINTSPFSELLLILANGVMFPFYITFYLVFCCTNRSFTPAFTRKWGLSSSFTRMIILDNSCWHISDIKTKFARISWIEVFKPFQFPVEEEQMLSMVFVVADNQQLVNSKPPISLYQVKNSSLSNRQLLFFFYYHFIFVFYGGEKKLYFSLGKKWNLRTYHQKNL